MPEAAVVVAPRSESDSSYAGEFQRSDRGRLDRIRDVREQLPIRLQANQVLRFLAMHETAILIGETGCGKSTQVPQLLYEHGLHRDMVIGVTQPRRVAAISLALRVAGEMDVCIGREVGYSVRFDEIASDLTRIFYLTEGMLIREAIYGGLLERYSTIILDEVHERTLQTDVLFGVVKAAQKMRAEIDMAPLKVIIMSATMDVDHISAFFNQAPVAYCEGRMYPVQVFYAPSCGDDYFYNTLVAVFQIHRNRPLDGDILCFLTGQEEIEAAVAKCREEMDKLGAGAVVVLPFYASLSNHQQMKVFKVKRKGKERRVIMATNVAETSITIPNIRYVIDCGKVKMRMFEPNKGVDLLRVVNASKAQVDQRAGRAGREASGQCCRLYSEAHYTNLPEFAEPEVKRCSLATVCLHLLVMGISDARKFDFMDAPSEESLTAAYTLLRQLGAVNVVQKNRMTLSVMGETMAAFPVDPKFSRAILAGASLHCSEEVVTVVALLSAGNIFSSGSQGTHDELSRLKFFAPEGDLIRLLNMFNVSRRIAPSELKTWCMENNINYRHLAMAEKIRAQLRNNCVGLNINLASCNGNHSLVCRALCYGFFMQAAELDPTAAAGGAVYKVLSSGLQAKIHPSSCLHQHKPACLLFNELSFTSQLYLRDVTVVDREFLEDLVPYLFRSTRSSRLNSYPSANR